jgi:hypothetical protein
LSTVTGTLAVKVCDPETKCWSGPSKEKVGAVVSGVSTPVITITVLTRMSEERTVRRTE